MTGPTPRDWLIACLRGSPLPWSTAGGPAFAEALWQSAQAEGVLPLMQHRLNTTGALDRLPADLRRRLGTAVKQAAAAEHLGQEELREVLAELAGIGIEPLLMKGTSLAYSLYPLAYLRSRCDTDLLVPDRPTAERVWQCLQPRGYQRPMTISGNLVSHEFSCWRAGTLGLVHTLDIHWRLSNMHRFAAALGFEELTAQAIPLPALGPHAQGLGPAHALLLAAMHRIAHLADGSVNRLIWLWDIHHLAQSLSAAQWDELQNLARHTGQCGVCLEGLTRTAETFATALPADLLAELRLGAEGEDFDPRQSATRLGVELSNLKSLDSWPARLALIAEHLFPDAEYMRAKYPSSARARLPLLYLRRILEGIPKLWRSHTG